jgi:hypothetical protein
MTAITLTNTGTYEIARNGQRRNTEVVLQPLRGKVKSKVVPLYAMEALLVRAGIAPTLS